MVQRYLNSSYQRVIKTTPHEVLTGVKMKIGQDVHMAKIIIEALITPLDEDRENQRKAVRKSITKAQTDQEQYYDESRKKPQKYKIGDIVPIRRTQFATTSKWNQKFLGSYVIVKCNGHEIYDVQRIGKGNGPKLNWKCFYKLNDFSTNL